MSFSTLSLIPRAGRSSVRAARAAAAHMGVVAGGLLVGDLERVTAAARGDGVRVVDREPGGLDRVDIVDLGPLEVGGAERVDHDRDAVRLELVVALLRAAVESEPVLEARAASALDRHAEHVD